MTGAATLITPDRGSTRPGATASQRLSSAESLVAAWACPCADVLAGGTASEATSTLKDRTANTAVLPFAVIITSTPSLLRLRTLHLRSGRLRCARCDWRMAGYVDRALRPAARETGPWRSGRAAS